MHGSFTFHKVSASHIADTQRHQCIYRTVDGRTSNDARYLEVTQDSTQREARLGLRVDIASIYHDIRTIDCHIGSIYRDFRTISHFSHVHIGSIHTPCKE